MKIHRFYEPELSDYGAKEFVVTDARVLKQWGSVLRFRAGHRVRLFDGSGAELLCEIKRLERHQAALIKISDVEPHMAPRNVHLFWALLKKSNNELILQKATELGVTHFHPVVSERSEKRDISDTQHDRWMKICVEASEQCGRGDIPVIAQVQGVQDAINTYANSIHLYIAEQLSDGSARLQPSSTSGAIGGFVGPEGGWSKEELELYSQKQLPTIRLSSNTLRAETAAIMLAGRLTYSDVA